MSFFTASRNDKNTFKLYVDERKEKFLSFFLFILQQMPGKVFTYLTITSKRVVF